MSTINPTRNESSTLIDQETRLARQSGLALASLMKHERETRLYIHSENDPPTEIALPSSAARLLLGALEEIGKGKNVILIPTDAELTTQQAAVLARVSRPFFIKLLDEGKISYRMVGSHRRILFRDVANYNKAEETRRVKVMEELVAETERLGLYV